MGILLTYTPRMLLFACLLFASARTLPAQWRQSSKMAELYQQLCWEHSAEPALTRVLADPERYPAHVLLAAAGAAFEKHDLENAGFLLYAAQLRGRFDQALYPANEYGARSVTEVCRNLQNTHGAGINPELLREPALLRRVYERLKSWTPQRCPDDDPGYDYLEMMPLDQARAKCAEHTAKFLKEQEDYVVLLEIPEYQAAFRVLQVIGDDPQDRSLENQSRIRATMLRIQEEQKREGFVSKPATWPAILPASWSTRLPRGFVQHKGTWGVCFMGGGSPDKFVPLPDVDAATMRVLQPSGAAYVRYAVDAQHVYKVHDEQAFAASKNLKTPPVVLDGADPATFELLTPSGSYAKDAARVYFLGIPLPGADPKTFEPLLFPYAQDAQHAYCGFTPLAVRDRKTWQPLRAKFHNGNTWDNATQRTRPIQELAFEGWSKDAQAVYCGTKLLPGADPATFVVHNKYYAQDARQVYFDFMPEPACAARGFEVLRHGYAKTPERVYHGFVGSIRVTKADPATFVTRPHFVPPRYDAEDARHTFYYHRAMFKDPAGTWRRISPPLLTYDSQVQQTATLAAAALLKESSPGPSTAPTRRVR